MEIHQQQPPRPASQKLPTLNGILNSPEDNRDSAYFSSNDVSSKHTSAASGINLLNNPVYGTPSTDKTPSPVTTTLIPGPLASPSGSMSVASMVSPTTPGGADPRRSDRPQSLESVPNGATLGGANGEPESRRQSVDSRMNQNFGEMRLGGNSPYATHNHSTTSIQGTLAQQRNPRPNFDNLSVNRISNGYQPNADRTPDAHVKAIRTAPAITGPTTGSIARAAEPIKGQAWAFPEDAPPPQSYIDSRRSSVADSLASSQLTAESRLPPGQRRLDEVSPDYSRLSRASGEFPAVHHHTLQHKQLGDLRTEEGSSHTGSQPYSRTPELRISHKLAERKRRTEMKELFEQLRDLMPQERGSKASKWEILTKAISEHQRQNDVIRNWQAAFSKQEQDIAALRHELQVTRQENERLRSELGGRLPPQQAAPSADPYPGAGDPFQRSRTELPPLRSLSGTGPESMTGVQYDGPRATGFGAGRF